MSISGVVPIDKSGGMTSHDVVNRVRRLFGIRRVGHAGTLDPMATGVLVVCLGAATRIAEYLAASRKTYRAAVVFGVTTDTEDSTGHIIAESDASQLTEERLLAILPGFMGAIQQIPPMVSAVHHEGKRLYELAREGIEVERKPRDVNIHRLELLSFTPGRNPRAELEIECSAGTYIRTLAADIGQAAAVGAMMDSLQRTQSGRFTLADCSSLEVLAERKESAGLDSTVLTIADSLSDWQHFRLSADDMGRVLNGQSIAADSSIAETNVLLLDKAGNAVAVAESRQGRLHPIKVFGAQGD